jgi:hypothetical protein
MCSPTKINAHDAPAEHVRAANAWGILNRRGSAHDGESSAGANGCKRVQPIRAPGLGTHIAQRREHSSQRCGLVFESRSSEVSRRSRPDKHLDANAETPSITRLEGSRWRGGRLWSWNRIRERGPE